MKRLRFSGVRFRHGRKCPGVGMTYRGGFLLLHPSTSYLSVGLSFGHWKSLPAKHSSLPQSSGTGPLFCFKTLHLYIKTIISNTYHVPKTGIRIHKSSRYFSVRSVTKMCQPRAKARNWQVLIQITQKGCWNLKHREGPGKWILWPPWDKTRGNHENQADLNVDHGRIAYLGSYWGLSVLLCKKG